MAVQISDSLARQIVDSVKDVCGYDINFINPAGIIRTSTDDSRIGTYHEIGHTAAKTGQVIEVYPGEQYRGTQPGVNIPLSHEGDILCVIGITGNPEEVRRFAWLAVRITQLILKEQTLEYSLKSMQDKRDYVVRALTSREAVNSRYLEECMEQLSLVLESRMCAARICLEAKVSLANVSLIDRKIKEMVERAGIRLYRFRYPSEYIFLFGESQSTPVTVSLKNLAQECFPLLSVGIGSLQDVSALLDSYIDAGIAEKAARQKSSRFAGYAELDLEILLSGNDPARSSRFRNRVLSELSEEDRELLKVYFSSESSLVRAADELHMHKNTLQYRLNRIFRLCGYNPRSFRDAAVLYLALQC